MNKRRMLILGLSILMLGLIIWRVSAARSGVSLNNAQRIKEGMTREDIASIMGSFGTASWTREAEGLFVRWADNGIEVSVCLEGPQYVAAYAEIRTADKWEPIPHASSSASTLVRRFIRVFSR